MNRHIFTVIGIAIILFSTNGYCGDVFVLSLSDDIVEYDSGNGKIKTIFQGEDCRWPCYDRKNNTLYFSSHAVIYSMELGRADSPRSKVLNGRLPAISPGGKLLSFLVQDNIYVFDTESKKSWLVGTDAIDFLPAVWISDKQLIYYTGYRRMKVIDAISGQISGFWPADVFPRALSPDGKTLLCKTIDPSIVLLYNTDGSYVDTIMKLNKFSYMVGSLVWSSSGKSFIYEHKSWFGFSPGENTYDVYMFNVETRKEKRIMHDTHIEGGFSIGPSNTKSAVTGDDSETPQAVEPNRIPDQTKWAWTHD